MDCRKDDGDGAVTRAARPGPPSWTRRGVAARATGTPGKYGLRIGRVDPGDYRRAVRAQFAVESDSAGGRREVAGRAGVAPPRPRFGFGDRFPSEPSRDC